MDELWKAFSELQQERKAFDPGTAASMAAESGPLIEYLTEEGGMDMQAATDAVEQLHTSGINRSQLVEAFRYWSANRHLPLNAVFARQRVLGYWGAAGAQHDASFWTGYEDARAGRHFYRVGEPFPYAQGFLAGRLGHIPQLGDRVRWPEQHDRPAGTGTVDSLAGLRIAMVGVKPDIERFSEQDGPWLDQMLSDPFNLQISEVYPA